MELHKIGKHTTCTIWSDRRKSRLNTFDENSLFPHECGTLRVAMRKSNIPDERAEKRCIVSQNFGKWEQGGRGGEYYYGTTVFYTRTWPESLALECMERESCLWAHDSSGPGKLSFTRKRNGPTVVLFMFGWLQQSSTSCVISTTIL